MHLGAQGIKKWFLVSGFSRYMISDKAQFIIFTKKERMITFADNGKGHKLGTGKVCIAPSIFIKNILLVNGLKHNFLSISQLCNKGCKVVF